MVVIDIDGFRDELSFKGGFDNETFQVLSMDRNGPNITIVSIPHGAQILRRNYNAH